MYGTGVCSYKPTTKIYTVNFCGGALFDPGQISLFDFQNILTYCSHFHLGGEEQVDQTVCFKNYKHDGLESELQPLMF